MTETSSPSSRLPVLPLVTQHVIHQFGRRGDLAEAQFLYGEIARRMFERLEYIRLDPAAMLDAGCGAGASLPALRQRYAAARYVGLDACAPLLEHARKAFAPSAGARMRQSVLGLVGRAGVAPPEFVCADLAASGLAPESMDLVWSNLALHWHPAPHAVLAEWRRVLKVGALTMFSCLGPNTFQQLRDALALAGLQTATPAFVDMHDFGDLLVENGFSDPVMDQEIITLTYRDAPSLLADVRRLGGNPAAGRRPGLVGRRWRQRLCEALESARRPDGLLHLTIEAAYGHAWRANSHRTPTGETVLSISSIGRGARR